MNLSQIQKNLANLQQIPSKMWKPLDMHMHVRRERRFTWRGGKSSQKGAHTP